MRARMLLRSSGSRQPHPRPRRSGLKLASGPSNVTGEVLGPPQHIAAGQHRDATLQQPGIVVATGAAANTAPEAASATVAENVDKLKAAPGGRNAVHETAACTTRYCFGTGHGMGGPHVHQRRFTSQGPQRATVTPMTERDAKEALDLIRRGEATLGGARRDDGESLVSRPARSEPEV